MARIPEQENDHCEAENQRNSASLGEFRLFQTPSRI